MEHDRRAVDPLIEIRTVTETGSTNTDMLALAAAGASEGSWLRAERQTAGRGRQGRKWIPGDGNLYASTLVRLRPGDPSAPGLALVAGVALWEAVEAALNLAANHYQVGVSFRDHEWDEPFDNPAGSASFGLENGLVLKWPNDLLLEGAKLGGILLERADDAVVVGIGLNCRTRPQHLDQQVTSLNTHGVWADPTQLLASIAGLFAATVSLWRTDGFASVRRLWLERAHPVGTPLSVKPPIGATIDGVFGGLDAAGALLLRLATGEDQVVHAGDVLLV